MISKSTFQTINNALRLIISIVLIGFGLFHFFVHKISLKGLNFIIFWFFLGLGSLADIINAKFFENNFTLKTKGYSVCVVAMSIFFIIFEIIL